MNFQPHLYDPFPLRIQPNNGDSHPSFCNRIHGFHQSMRMESNVCLKHLKYPNRYLSIPSLLDRDSSWSFRAFLLLPETMRNRNRKLINWQWTSVFIVSFTLFSSFCSIEEIILHDARRAPITFLYATDKRFRSSTVSSTSREATFFMASTISGKKKKKKYFSWRDMTFIESFWSRDIQLTDSDLSLWFVRDPIELEGQSKRNNRNSQPAWKCSR